MEINLLVIDFVKFYKMRVKKYSFVNENVESSCTVYRYYGNIVMLKLQNIADPTVYLDGGAVDTVVQQLTLYAW